jgi:CTP:molybdopterin cytidylyltransferase MocA
VLTAILVAAGDSRRMGFDKLFAAIAGRPVISHTIHAFERADMLKSKRLFAMKTSRKFVRSFRAANIARILFAQAWINWKPVQGTWPSMMQRAR